MASLEHLLAAGGTPPTEGGKSAYEHPLVERYAYLTENYAYTSSLCSIKMTNFASINA